MVFSALQLVFLFFLQENELRKALIPFIGVRKGNAIDLLVLVFLCKEKGGGRACLQGDLQEKRAVKRKCLRDRYYVS
jgi:hypothetical protein